MPSLIAVQNLVFSYTGDVVHPVFRDVSFVVAPGDVFCLLGPNGTGKSTLLKCLSNVLRGWQGSIRLADREISRLRPADIAREIGYVPQNQISTFPFLVKDVVVMGRASHLNVFSSPTTLDDAVAYRAMETVGILELADRPCTTLSGGEWQLTLIARALTQEPRILVLDEPTSHLDMGNQMKILRVVKGLADGGLAVIMASHFPDHAFMIATEVAILNRGCIVRKGPPDMIITDQSMRDTYGVDVKVLLVEAGVERRACFPLLKDLYQPLSMQRAAATPE